MSIFTNWIKNIAMDKVKPYLWAAFFVGVIVGLILGTVIRIAHK